MSEVFKSNSESPENFFITDSQPEDVEAIEKMRYQSWLETYPNDEFGVTKEMIEERFAPKLSTEGLEKRREQYLQNQKNPDILNLVAKDDAGQVIGYVFATRGDEGNEIDAIYTNKVVHGIGIGGALMQRALDWIGNEDSFLLVTSYNERAKNFYKKFGFIEVGEPFIDNVPNMPLQRMERKTR